MTNDFVAVPNGTNWSETGKPLIFRKPFPLLSVMSPLPADSIVLCRLVSDSESSLRATVKSTFVPPVTAVYRKPVKAERGTPRASAMDVSSRFLRVVVKSGNGTLSVTLSLEDALWHVAPVVHSDLHTAAALRIFPCWGAGHRQTNWLVTSPSVSAQRWPVPHFEPVTIAQSPVTTFDTTCWLRAKNVLSASSCGGMG